MVVNATMYDACLEKVCINMGIPCVSQSEKQAHFTCALKLTKSHLLSLWKDHSGPMTDKLPRYSAEPSADVMPASPQEPSLNICSLVDGSLCLPRNIRVEWLSDPVRSPEWKRMLVEFDRCFGTAADPASAPAPAADDGNSNEGAPSFDWATAFEEPTDKEAWHQKYDAKVQGKFTWCPELTAYIVDDDPAADPEAPKKYKLFIEAMEAYTLTSTDAFLTYGAGVWLLDAKAESFLNENPQGHRGVLCKFVSDTLPVVLEARLISIDFT